MVFEVLKTVAQFRLVHKTFYKLQMLYFDHGEKVVEVEEKEGEKEVEEEIVIDTSGFVEIKSKKQIRDEKIRQQRIRCVEMRSHLKYWERVDLKGQRRASTI